MVDKKIRIILDSSGAKKNADELNRSVVGVGKAADNSAFSMNRLAAAIAAVISIQKLKQYSDAWTSINNQLRQTVQTQEGLVAITDELTRVSIESRQSLEETASLYTRFRLSISETELSSERLVGVIDTINKSLAIGGATAAESAGALRQLSQAIASGVLRGEEFNSIAEQAPEILRAVSQATGKTAGELRALAADGAITSDVLIKSLEAYAETVDTKFAASVPTIDQAFEVLRTNTISFVGNVNDALGASENFANGIIKLGNTIGSAEFLSGFLETIEIARLTINSITESTSQFSEELILLGDIGSDSVGFVGKAFKELLPNVKSLVQVVTVEALSVFDKLRVSSEALFQIFSRPFDEDNLKSATDSYHRQIDAINSAREDSIQLIFDEREAILSSAESASKARLKEIEERRKARIEAPKNVSGAPIVSIGDGGLSDKDIAKRDSNFQDEINGARAVTEALKLELDTRRKISDAYREAQKISASDPYEYERALLNARMEEEKAEAAQRLSEDALRREEQRRQALEDQTLTAEQRWVLNAYYDEQEVLQKQLHQETITAIEKDAADQRIRIAEAERMAKQQLTFDMLSSGVALLQAFGSQSEKTQKRLAKVSIAVDTAQGIAKGVKLGWPLGIPAVAWAIANGKMALDRLNSAGSSASSAPASVSAGSSLPETFSSGQQPQFQQKQVIEIRGAIDGNSLVRISDLPEILGQDNMVISIQTAQQDAQRRGVI